MKKKLLFIQIIISVLVLTVLFNQYSLSGIISQIKVINIRYIGILLVITLFIIPLLAAFRWKTLLNQVKVKISFKEILIVNFKSMFIGLAIPSSDGYAAVRIVLLEKKMKGNRGLVTATVLVEKLLGVMVLCFVGMGFGIYSPLKELSTFAAIILLIIVISLFLLMFVTINSKFGKTLEKLSSKIGVTGLADFLERLKNGIRKFRVKNLIIQTLPLVILIQFWAIFVSVLIFEALGVKLTLMNHLALVPLIQIVTLIPISFNGTGLREALFASFYGLLHVSKDVAIATAVLSFLFLIVLPAIVGGFVMWSNSLFLDKREIISGK